MGPGGGTRKFGLPEPHTDYIFSVIGEEFGLIACLAIASLYLGIVARVLIKLLDEDNSFSILAAAGLAIQFGLQALINMMVNVQLAPSKGMTLPFISYGGSSMLALSIGMGLLLAFTRRNPYLTRSPYVVKWSGESLTSMNFVLAAGGTGGHMIPAHALAAELKARGHGVLLITDERGARFPGLFDGVPVHILPAGPARRRAARLAQGGWRGAEGAGRGQAPLPRAHARRGGRLRRLSGVSRAARRQREQIPTVLHEQNAVLGRVNRLLAGEADAIGTAYDRGRPAEAADIATRSSSSAIRCATKSRASASCRSRRSTRTRRSRSWSPAAARARRILGRSCPKGSACSIPRFAAGSRSSSNAGPTTSSASASAMPSSASPPS